MTVGRWAYQERSCKEIEATRKSPRKTSFKNITGLLRKNEFCWVHARTVTDAQAGVGWEVHVGEEGCPPFSLDLLFFSPVHTSFQLPTPAHPLPPLAHCQPSPATPARPRPKLAAALLPAPAWVRQHPQMFAFILLSVSSC